MNLKNFLTKPIILNETHVPSVNETSLIDTIINYFYSLNLVEMAYFGGMFSNFVILPSLIEIVKVEYTDQIVNSLNLTSILPNYAKRIQDRVNNKRWIIKNNLILIGLICIYLLYNYIFVISVRFIT
jgi:hypothetical protein